MTNMLQNFSLEVPLCHTSLGVVSMGILVELFNRGVYPNIFPLGAIDISLFTALPEGFREWLQLCLNKAQGKFKRGEESVRIFHVQNSHSRIGQHSRLYCPHECSTLTDIEKNILSNHDRVLVPSNYNKQIFERHGIAATVCPNFFDSANIHPTKVHKDENVTVWSFFGKLEKRKNIIPTIRAWDKLYGGKKEHRLHLSVFNMFLFPNVPPEQKLAAHKAWIENELGFPLKWNVELFNFLSFSDFNQLLNCTDIDLSGLSGSEGFGLPFHSTRCLGRRGISLNAHAHLDYADNQNSVLVQPNGMEDIKDGVFFSGAGFNVGEKYTFAEDDAMRAMEEALARPEPSQEAAQALKERFSVANTVDILLSND